jgi:hypothetical protein
MGANEAERKEGDAMKPAMGAGTKGKRRGRGAVDRTARKGTTGGSSKDGKVKWGDQLTLTPDEQPNIVRHNDEENRKVVEKNY